MRGYEIRLLKPGGGAAVITIEIQLSDKAAIASGKRLANGLKFEVWKDDKCIHGATAPICALAPSNTRN
jgi:hypothetical protein